MYLDDQITSISPENHILITFQPLNAMCMITNWNEGVHFYKRHGNQWKSEDIDPGFVLISDIYTETNCSAAYHFMQQFPNDLKNRIMAFSQNQFSLIKMFSQYPSLLDIFSHSPNLVWMSIVKANKEQWSVDETVKLLHHKREMIAAKIFQSNSKRVVNFINKVQLLNGDQYEFRLINECCMNTNIIRFFFHWKIIPVHALVLARKYPMIMKTSILPGLLDLELTLYKQQSVFSPVAAIIKDIELMADLMNIRLSNHYFKSLSTISKVNRAHDRLIDRVNDSNTTLDSKVIVYPLCPLGDTDNVIQIKNNVALASEGRAMHHCVAGYGSYLLDGNSFIYKVIAPERGTLHITWKDNKYDISQFRLLCNGQPSQDSFNIILQWLTQAQS